jgi:hypothetical protein
MTTPADIWLTTIPTIRDRESLQLVGRLIESQVMVLEAQLGQLKQVHGEIQKRMKATGR